MSLETIDVFRFMGVTHFVSEHEGTQYLALKPLVDQIGLDWRTQKRSVLDADEAILYGTRRIASPENAVQGGISPPKDGLFIRIDRVSIYLARISVNRVRANGNIEAAEFLLALQLEWADALHNYETRGVAVKAGHFRQRDQRRKEFLTFATLIKTRSSTANKGERQALTAAIKETAADLKLPVAGDLFDDDVAA